MTQLATDERLPATGFSGAAEVEVRQLNDTDWVTLSRLYYDTGGRTFTVPSGQLTDFASVPRVFVWFLPRHRTWRPYHRGGQRSTWCSSN